MSPESLVAPNALPLVMLTSSESVLAALVELDATLLARSAYGTAVSLNRGVISLSAGVQAPNEQEPVPRMVIPR